VSEIVTEINLIRHTRHTQYRFFTAWCYTQSAVLLR